MRMTESLNLSLFFIACFISSFKRSLKLIFNPPEGQTFHNAFNAENQYFLLRAASDFFFRFTLGFS